MISDITDETIENLFQSLLSRYQNGLETLIRGSNLSLIVFLCVFIIL